MAARKATEPTPDLAAYSLRACARVERAAKRARRKADAERPEVADAHPATARLHGFARGYAAGLERALEMLETTPYEAPASRKRK